MMGHGGCGDHTDFGDFQPSSKIPTPLVPRKIEGNPQETPRLLANLASLATSLNVHGVTQPPEGLTPLIHSMGSSAGSLSPSLCRGRHSSRDPSLCCWGCPLSRPGWEPPGTVLEGQVQSPPGLSSSDPSVCPGGGAATESKYGTHHSSQSHTCGKLEGRS